MTKHIKSRLKQLRLEKAARQGNALSIREVSRETGIAVSTLRHVESGNLKSIEFATVTRLMDYYGVNRLDEVLEVTEEDRLTRVAAVAGHLTATRAFATHAGC